MKAEIIAVGTEILLGDIVNTNSQYVAKRLKDLGIFVYYQTVAGDNEERLYEAYKLAFKRADLVIAIGGLGPTKDDLTKETAFKLFNKKAVLDEESFEKIKNYFSCTKRKITEGTKKQAYFPKDAVILKNNHGTAPGCVIEDKGKTMILLPGPPKEMVPMFEESVVPYLKKYSDCILVSKVLRIFGIGEGQIVEKIDDIIESQTNPTVASYAKENEATLRITAKAGSKEEADSLISLMEKKIRGRIGKYIYGEDDEPIENVLGRLLIEKKLKISAAESCTGGLLSAKIINYPGISESFMEGCVTYTNEAKMRRLGVRKETIEKYGAVSSETAKEMAEGIAKGAETDIGVSTTGNAGPFGSEDKDVGLVYIGLYIRGKVEAKEFHFSGDRQKVRNRAVMEAIFWILNEIKQL